VSSVWIVLLAAGVAGGLTLALLPQLTSIPRERWATAALRPVFSQSAIAAVLPGMLALAFRAPDVVALAAALGGGAFAITRLAIRYAPIRAVKRLTAQLGDDAKRSSAMAAIGPALDRARPAASDVAALGTWAQAGLIGAAYLVDADEPEAARGVLERMSGLSFRGPSLANHALIWAHVEIFANDLVAARSALDSVKKPVALPLLDAHCEALEALALACEGHAATALARVDGWKHSETWYGKLRLTVRIVAHAMRGDRVARERNEAELTRRFGTRAVRAARQLADAYATESEPYRDGA
jgi:hypothetical protein